MTFLDWSDSEELIGLLIEYVSDERNESDGERRAFLSDLLTNLQSEQINAVRLQNIYESVDPDFKNDDVIAHLHDCIEELKRLKQE
jgi:hypothetical protein